MRVTKAMQCKITYLSPEHTLREAYEAMKDGSFRHIPVIEEDILVGILSDRDVLARSVMDEDGVLEVPDMLIANAMTKDFITCSATAQIADIADVMIDSQIDAMPVTDEAGHLEGLVTSTDLLGLLRDRTQETNPRTLPLNWYMNQSRTHIFQTHEDEPHFRTFHEEMRR